MEIIGQLLQGAVLPLIQLLYMGPVWAAAALWARRFDPCNLFEYLAAAGFLSILLMIALPGALGLAGILSVENALIASWSVGAVALILERKGPRLRLRKLILSVPELVIAAAALGFLCFLWRNFGYLPCSGTDAHLYHLYYPAVWLLTGTVERISQPGLLTASYPCYGELVYAWQMAPLFSDFFAKNFQFYFLFFAFFGTAAAGIAAGYRRIEALAAAALVVFCDVIYRSGAVPNTDMMVGADALLGMAFLMIGVRRKNPGWLPLGGAALGVAAATKYQGLLVAPFFFLIGGLAIWLYRPDLRRRCLIAAATAILVASPCFVANWIVTGNPLYPTRIAIGGWAIFPQGLPEREEGIGLGMQAWHYFVDGNVDSPSAQTALILLAAFLLLLAASWTARFAASGRREKALAGYRSRAAVTLGAAIAVGLVLQLELCPRNAQPRQIIPVAMLAGLGSVELFRLLRDLVCRRCDKAFTAVALAAAFAVSCGALRHQHQLEALLHIGAAIVLFLLVRLPNRRLRICVWSLCALFLLFDAGYRYRVYNYLAPQVRPILLSRQDETALQMIESGRPEGAVINYCGTFYLHYLGTRFQNRVVTIPITASGGENNWDYRSLAEARIPGRYADFLERLRKAGVDYLLSDRNTFAAPNGAIEYDWAKEHPEDFQLLFEQPGFALFELRRR